MIRKTTYMQTIFAFACLFVATVHAEIHSWKGKNGKVVKAEFVYVSIDRSHVSLRLPNGKIVNTAIAGLSEEDQRYIKQNELPDFARWNKAHEYYKTGQMYYFGDDVRQSFETAAQYYKRAVTTYHDRDGYFSLGLCYSQGLGVAKNLQKARASYKAAAERGHLGAQNNLAIMLEDGTGGERNKAKSLYWFRKAAAKESPVALNNLGSREKYKGNTTLAADYFMRAGEAYLKQYDGEGVLKTIDLLQGIGAAALARTLSDKLYGKRTTSRVSPSTAIPASSGTGWFCASKYVVTCWHVLDGHDRFYLISEALPKTPLKLVMKDRQNDLAILEIPSHDLTSHGILPISMRSPVTAGTVFTSGFPHVDFLGKAPKYTEGSISAVSGFDDDPRILQISVPVQSGNSGGPLLDERGCVVGIVASKLAAARIFEWTGDLPQNINYAVKSAYLRTLLDGKGIKFASEPTWAKGVSRQNLIKEVNKAVVLILAE